MKFVNFFTRPLAISLCVALLAVSAFSGAVRAQDAVQDTVQSTAKDPSKAVTEVIAKDVAEGSAEVLAPASAHQVLEVTTKKLMRVITEAQQYYDTDPERFYVEIETLLNEVVDFNGFARGVMGKYASKKAYQALKTKEEKLAFRARMARFSDVFKEGLVKTYAKGLLAFNGNRIDVLPPETDAPAQGSVTVVQHIYGEAATPYVVSYKMRQDQDAQWKLRNLTIEAINLGIIYRSQFYSAAKRYDGDIDQVIDGWSVDPSGQ